MTTRLALWLAVVLLGAGALALALWRGLEVSAAPHAPCAAVCYVNAVTGNDANDGDTPLTAKRTLAAAVASVAPGGLVSVAAGLYVETITLTQPITIHGAGAGGDPTQHTILSGFGVPGRAPGIRLTYAASDITLQGLRVQFHDNGGICGAGENNRLTLHNVQIYTSVAGDDCVGGIHLIGPINGLTLDEVEVRFSSLRGLMVWLGAKRNIRITNSVFAHNGGWGVSLHDGSASGVVITNTVIHNNFNGLMLTGLTGGDGPNWIADNILLNNGQRGLELRQPNGTGADSGDGAVVVQGNLIALTQPITALVPLETRDLAGLAVIRHNVLPPNVDVPQGVVARFNTVSGYRQVHPASYSDGYGIVIEGVNMRVEGNTLAGNDIGLQFQQGHGPYFPHVNINGDETNRPDDFFGYGNAPVVSGWARANTLTDHRVAVRVAVSGTAASALTFTQNSLVQAVTAGAVITAWPAPGYAPPLTVTWGGDPAQANLFRAVPLALQVHAPPTATLSALWNDWLAAPNTVPAVEALVHHRADDPALAQVSFYTFTLQAPTHVEGAAVMTLAVSGLFTPTGQVMDVASPLLTTTLLADITGTASLTLTSPDPLTVPVTASVGLTVNHAFTRHAEIVFAGLRIADLSAVTLTHPPGLTDTETLTVTTRVSNAGPSRALAHLHTALWGALADVAWTCAGSACPAPAGAGDLSATVTLPAHAALTLTMQAATTAPGVVTHTVSVAGPVDFVDVHPDDNLAVITVPVQARQADWQVALAAPPSHTLPGLVTFTAVISNPSGWLAAGGWLTADLAGPAVPLTWICAPACAPASGVGAPPPLSLTLPAESALTFTLAVSPTAPGAVTLTVQASAPPLFVDADLSNNQASATTLIHPAAPTVFTLWLPVMTRALVAPDVVIESLTATATAVTLTVRNIGSAPVTSGFWVDVYLAPHTPPTAVNQLWPGLAPQGLVWGVPNTVTLLPGHSLTLTQGGPYFVPAYSLFVMPLAPGSVVYAQVDSFNPATTYGLVWEGHEMTGGAYNNITGPVWVP